MTAAPWAATAADTRAASTRQHLVAALCFCLAVVGGLLAAVLTQGGHASAAAAAVGIIVPIVIWHRPQAGIFFLFVSAVAVEQFEYVIGSTTLGDVTEHLPLFTSLQGIGLSGFSVSPIELLLLLTVITWMMRAAADGTLRFPRSQLATGMYGMLGIAVLGLALGLARGGDYKMALWEVRPWFYLVAMFVVASQLLTTRRSVETLLWAFVIGTGVQAAQGAWLVYETRSVVPRPEALLAHEEAFFFGIFLVLTLALWLLDIRGALRRTATALAPLVFVADLGNDRRTAWLILGAAVPAMMIAAYVAAPHRRGVVRRAAIALVVVSGLYFPAFWNDGGLAGQPARAVRSLVAPDWRDDQSNGYRRLEDANLGVDIKRSTPIGTGLGLPIDYSIPIVDISNVDSLIKFVPHDGVLYVWMRFGLAGILLFWSLVGAAILAACRLLRAAEAQLKLLGGLATCAVLAYLIQGYADLGLFWFRIAIVMGCVLGCVQASRGRAEAGTTSGEAA